MVDVSSQNNSASINVSSGGNSASIKATPDMAQYYSEKSREWAISNRIVDNTDYSSKYYAEKSKESEAKNENYERSVIEKYNSFIDVSSEAEAALQMLRDDSVSQINTVASSGISDIANKTSEAITEINAKKETATNEINNAKNSAVTQLSKEAQEVLKESKEVLKESKEALETRANIDLSNLSEEGEKHFLNKTQITNCILEAPNGVATYSGDTITIKQGLKVLIPNGKNADGTLKNIEYTLKNDSTHSSYIGSEERSIFLSNLGSSFSYNTLAITISNHNPTNIEYNMGIWHQPSENKWFETYDYGTTWNERLICYIGKFLTNNTQIIGLYPETTVELFKRQDRNEISGLAMPSNQYIDLTLGASGSTYTAPANGWFYLSKVGTAAGQYVTFENASDGAPGESCSYVAWGKDYTCVLLRPVKKGTTTQLRYSASGKTNYFRFIYAEGEA